MIDRPTASLVRSVTRFSNALGLLTVGQWVYLQRSVSRDLARKREALDTFTPRPGQDPAQVKEAREKLVSKITFLEELQSLLRTHEPRKEHAGIALDQP